MSDEKKPVSPSELLARINLNEKLSLIEELTAIRIRLIDAECRLTKLER